MFEATMGFVPGLGLLPAPISRRIGEKIRQIRREGGLIVFGDQQVVAVKAIHLGTQFRLGMHGVEGENPSGDERGRQKRLEGADLILFLLHIDLEKHDAGVDIVGAELMHWLRFLTGRPHRFAINGHLCMLQMPRFRLQAARLVPAALLGFPAGKEGGQQVIEGLGINDL
jgi:hypothetical protein